MSKNFVWKITNGVFVAALLKENPTTTEWDQMLVGFQRDIAQIKGMLIHSEGGAPNALQRKKLRDSHTQNNTTLPISALLTDSMLARAAMVAVNLFFDNRIKAFASSNIDEALRYLSTPPAQWPEIKQAMDELKKELSA